MDNDKIAVQVGNPVLDGKIRFKVEFSDPFNGVGFQRSMEVFVFVDYSDSYESMVTEALKEAKRFIGEALKDS